MKLLVTGARDWEDRAYVFRTLDDVHAATPIDLIVEGGAPGADTFAREWADLRGVRFAEYPALWHRFGKRAGPERNGRMLKTERPDRVAAFHADLTKSKGTADMVRQARRAGVPVDVYEGEANV